MLKCAATCLLAVLSLQAVAATLSAEEKLLQANAANSELSSEIARLQKLLETKQEAVDALAVSRAARAAGAEAPQFKTVQGNLEFQVRRLPLCCCPVFLHGWVCCVGAAREAAVPRWILGQGMVVRNVLTSQSVWPLYPTAH